MSYDLTQAKEFKVPGVFRQAMIGQVGLLDPVKAINEIEQRVLENMQETLLAIDPLTGNIITQAADSFEVSADGRVITFVLRPDLYFSNGQKITAEDYAFALRRHLDPQQKSVYRSYVINIQGAVELMEGMFYHPQKIGIKATVQRGKQVLIITLANPYPKILYFFAHVASSPLHRESVEKEGEKHFALGHMHASGPFIGTQKKDDLLIFAKNPHYKSEYPLQLKQVQLYLFDNVAKAEKAFLKGEIDQFGTRKYPVSQRMIQKLKGSDVLFFQPDLRTFFIRFHNRHVPTGEYKIRQALSMALNRDEIATLALTSSENKSFSITPNQQHLYDPPHSYYYDLSSAIDILKSSGFCVDGLQNQCIDLPALEIIFPKSLLAQKVVLLIQSQWEKLGFHVIGLQSIPAEKFVAEIDRGLFMVALDEIAVDTFHFFDLLHSFASTQATSIGVQSKYYDELIEKASKATLWTDAVSTYRQAEGLLLREASVVPLFQTTTPFVKALYVKGFAANLWDVHRWKNISIE
ncbi:MAG: ABC transporter substrate-binding protein [Bdellovibrionota bacterium]